MSDELDSRVTSGNFAVQRTKVGAAAAGKRKVRADELDEWHPLRIAEIIWRLPVGDTAIVLADPEDALRTSRYVKSLCVRFSERAGGRVDVGCKVARMIWDDAGKDYIARVVILTSRSNPAWELYQQRVSEGNAQAEREADAALVEQWERDGYPESPDVPPKTDAERDAEEASRIANQPYHERRQEAERVRQGAESAFNLTGEKPKKKMGRPRIHPLPDPNVPKRKPGRPAGAKNKPKDESGS